MQRVFGKTGRIFSLSVDVYRESFISKGGKIRKRIMQCRLCALERDGPRRVVSI